MKYVIILLFILFLFGCEPNHVTQEKDMAMKSCIDKGGIPIMSRWANVMVDCKFPPEGSK